LDFTTTCFFGSGSESLLSDSDDEEESDEDEESETEYCQLMFARSVKIRRHILSVLALLFLTLLGLEAFACLFIDGILLLCGCLLGRTVRQEKWSSLPRRNCLRFEGQGHTKQSILLIAIK
jgi:hypothetical protein